MTKIDVEFFDNIFDFAKYVIENRIHIFVHMQNKKYEIKYDTDFLDIKDSLKEKYNLTDKLNECVKIYPSKINLETISNQGYIYTPTDIISDEDNPLVVTIDILGILQSCFDYHILYENVNLFNREKLEDQFTKIFDLIKKKFLISPLLSIWRFTVNIRVKNISKIKSLYNDLATISDTREFIEQITNTHILGFGYDLQCFLQSASKYIANEDSNALFISKVIESLVKIFSNSINRAFLVLDLTDFSELPSKHQLIASDYIANLGTTVYDNELRYWQLTLMVGYAHTAPWGSFKGIENRGCTGDGFFMVFENPIEALVNAIFFANKIDSDNANNASPFRIHYRISLHYGEVFKHYDISNKWNYIGDAINDTHRIVSVIENYDDFVVSSEDFRLILKSQKMQEKYLFYPSSDNRYEELLNCFNNVGSHFDKHNKRHRLHVVEHQKINLFDTNKPFETRFREFEENARRKNID